jgi:Rrf2 family protein
MAANSQFAIAVHILTLLAEREGLRVRSGEIAKSVNTNPVVIRRIISGLHEAGLVVSHVGAAGGNELSRCPNKIRLSEIYDAVSPGETFLVPERKANKRCPIGRNMAEILCGLQKEVDASIEKQLRKTTLQEIMRKALSPKAVKRTN